MVFPVSRHFIKCNMPGVYIDLLLLNLKDTQHLISNVYWLFNSMEPSGIDHIWHAWEKDLSAAHIDDVESVDAVKSIGRTCACNRLAETQYKILLRCYTNPHVA